ncbi:protein phosphatase CheZ [Herbaspirillum sp. RTI4]|uniref:protein phosphatase CheZ n=1 Tax=Herbaspirillum sp. RTI4 TaxID=3048640 RepID=UPI003A101601
MPEVTIAPASASEGLDAAGKGATQADLVIRVGQMTRNLHENLRGLGFDHMLEKAVNDMPDARDRLEYVARMTQQAAEKVLGATEAALPLQDDIGSGASALIDAWQAAGASGAQSDLAVRTVQYLQQARDNAQQTRQQLLDIMMAQDFQDLTGQVIKRITEVAHGIEQQLLQLLVDYSPPDARRDDTGLLNGPQIDPQGKDVIADQGQVDDLLASLGF